MKDDTLLKIKEAIEEYDARQEYHDKRIVRADKTICCTGDGCLGFYSVDDGYVTPGNYEKDNVPQLKMDSDALQNIMYIMQDSERSNLEKLRDIGREFGFDFKDYQKKE